MCVCVCYTCDKKREKLLWTKNNGCQPTDDRMAEEVFLCKVSIQLDMQMSC